MDKEVAVISNIFNPVGPSAPGGLEVFNYYLVKTLSEKGIRVKLFASGDSKKTKNLVPIVEKSLMYSKDEEYLSVPWHYRVITVREFAAYTKLIEELNPKETLIHFSLVNFLPIYLAVKKGFKIVTTIHMPVKNYHFQVLKDLLDKEELKKVHFVGVSNNQTKSFPYIYDVVYNGVLLSDFKYSEDFRDKFIWIGRMIKEKGVLDAISAIKKTSQRLEIAGAPKGKEETLYFENNIVPHFSGSIKYVGFVKAKERSRFYQAKASLFTSKMEESFGLTIIESMACGTPVIAYNQGAAKEIIKDGYNGYIVKKDDINGLKDAINKISRLDKKNYLEMRKNCRKTVEEKFTLDKMANKYIKIYKTI